MLKPAAKCLAALVVATLCASVATAGAQAPAPQVITGPVYDNSGAGVTLSGLLVATPPETFEAHFDLSVAPGRIVTSPPVAVAVDGPTPVAWAVLPLTKTLDASGPFRYRLVAIRADGTPLSGDWKDFSPPTPTGGGSPPCKTPNVLGRTRRGAVSAMHASGCRNVKVKTTDNVRDCPLRVIRQRPAAGVVQKPDVARTITLGCRKVSATATSR